MGSFIDVWYRKLHNALGFSAPNREGIVMALLWLIIISIIVSIAISLCAYFKRSRIVYTALQDQGTATVLEMYEALEKIYTLECILDTLTDLTEAEKVELVAVGENCEWQNNRYRAVPQKTQMYYL